MSKNTRRSKKSSQLITVVLALIILWGYTVPAVVSAERSSGGSWSRGSFQMIAAGVFHSLALKSDGSVVAWGSKVNGLTTVPADAHSGVVSIAAGEYHSLALKSDGSVVAWGKNNYSQTSVPDGLSGVVSIATGAYHSLALKSDGTVVAWGLNSSHQADVPDGLSGVVSIAAGHSHSLALKSDGTVVAWGLNSSHQADVPDGLSGVISIAAGDYYSLALKSNGTVVAWGSNSNGQADVPDGLSGVVSIVGGGAHSLALKSDGSVIAWGKNNYHQTNVPVNAKSDVVSIAGGSSHSLALKSDGSVIAWGFNAYGQTTVPAGLSSPVKAIAIAAGESHSLALKSDGSVVAWGKNNYSQTNVPEGLSGVVSIVTGWNHSLALKSDGSVVAWGKNDNGQTNVPTDAQSGIVGIAAGGNHSLALKSDGSVVAWGYNYWGQTAVPADAQSDIVAIAAGNGHSMALKSDGSVVAWGLNVDHQSTIPTNAQNGVVAIASGGYHSLVLKSNGSVIAWGYNFSGQTSVPTAAKNGVVAIEGGTHYSMALKSDGSVVAWGKNADGQTNIPTDARSGVVSISGGENHSLALKTDGSVVAWGSNNYGERTVPSSANLSNLAIDAGELSPSFVPSVTAYTYQLVGSSAASIDVTSILSDAANSMLLVNEEEQTSGIPVAVPLTGDTTEISVRVEPHLLRGKTYTITVSQLYTVTYDDNGSNDGNLPADNSAYSPDDSVTVLDNTGSLSRTGYTFAGWNTAADGSGTGYTPGDFFSMGTANVTLYAQWTIDSYTVSYDGNGNDGGIAPADVNGDYGSTVTVTGNTGNLVKTGYTFAGWNTEADGSGTSYTPGDAFMMGAGNVTLYAQWLDSFAPAITVHMSEADESPYANDTWTNRSVTVSVYASDDGSGVATLEYSEDGGTSWQPFVEALTYSEDGIYTLTLKATDEEGNEGQVTRKVKINRNGLVVTISASNQDGGPYVSGDWTNQSVTAEVNASHQQGIAVTSIAYSLDDGATWYHYTEPLTISGSGTHTIKVKTQDEAGNELEDVLTVKIDQINPSIEFGTNGNETWSLSGSTLVTVSDTESGLHPTALAFAWSQRQMAGRRSQAERY
ncbi:InlB B-repeat-containing protein [Paenibacillus sp. J5C_2022]|uniref:RCC1 domain-containing protein n=1 Tax=Paenibacillus sp. J5C2022 TaxID=2977129 RepID=UPI0021D33AB0|nr:InlB B-repeat-containing protein [Paenibacillus sp. J5C2022]MCU6711948.1 InlB B-repeat-containing protein [Paenibacillus sp. J5C2022]